MKQPDHARGAIGRTSGQDRVVAALMPIMAVVSIGYLIIGLAMPVLPLHVHLDSFIALCLLNAASPKQGVPPDFVSTTGESRMKLQTAAIAMLSLIAMPTARAEETAMTGSKPILTYEDVRKVAPALEAYTQNRLLGDVWKRPDLAPRDRSIVTLAVLIARNQTIEMPYHFNLALDNGVKPREISEIITHLAFYSGWANAMSAVAAAKNVFAARRIGVDQLPAASVTLLPIDEAAEAQRATSVQAQFGSFFPGVVQYTTDVLFRDLWLRPDLAPRDRSLVTVSALIANGQTAQLAPHLNRAMDNGLTQAQAAEVITHLAFYVGWPNVFSAMPIAKDVFEKRPH